MLNKLVLITLILMKFDLSYAIRISPYFGIGTDAFNFQISKVFFFLVDL